MGMIQIFIFLPLMRQGVANIQMVEVKFSSPVIKYKYQFNRQNTITSFLLHFHSHHLKKSNTCKYDLSKCAVN